MDFPEILCGNLFNFGHMLLSIKYSNSESNWLYVLVICILVVIEFLLIQTSYKKNKNTLIKFENISGSSKFGCWIIVLFPMIISYYQSFSDSYVLLIGSIGGLAIHCYSNKLYFESAVSIGLCAFVAYIVSNTLNILNLFYPIVLSLILSKVLPSFFTNVFSLGESIMLSQIICLFMLKSLYFAIFFIYYLTLTRSTVSLKESVKFNLILLLTFLFLFYLSCQYFSKHILDDLYLLFSLFSLRNCLLILIWIVLLVICLGIVYYVRAKVNKFEENCVSKNSLSKEKILHLRKVFHFGASMVFLSGLMWEAKQLLTVCSTALLVAMLLIEHIRQNEIGIIGKQLQIALSPFFDKRDTEVLVLSPIGLLCGLSLPIWISNLYENEWNNFENFWLYSGIITVGIGDSFAALIGRKWGRHYWNRKMKTRTMEGSLACLVSQLIVSSFILKFLYIPFSGQFAQKVLIAILMTTFVEAHTDQMDNFILPLVFCSFR